MSLADRVEDMIATLSPAWALNRAAARASLRHAEKLLSYRSAVPSRDDSPVYGRGSPADWNLETGFDRRKMVDRARQLERDNPIAEMLLSLSVATVVGDGFQLQAKSDDPNWNAEIEELFNEWADTEADERGLLTLSEILQVMWRSYLRDGDVGAVMLQEPGTIRVIESDEISSPEGGFNRPEMVDGVELDVRGRPKTFHVFDQDPRVLYSDRRAASKRLEIPAKDVVFLAHRQRAGQTRGVSHFNPLFVPLEQAQGTKEAAAVSNRMAAAFGLVIFKDGPWGGSLLQSPDASGTNRSQIRLEPGAIMRLAPNEKVQQIQASHPGSTTMDLIRMLLTEAAAVFGFPRELLLYDFSSSNFSNTKAAHSKVEEAAELKRHKPMRAASTFYRWKVTQFIEQRKTKRKPPSDFLKHAWLPRSYRWLEPVDEIQAAMLEVEAGFTTRRAVLARMGRKFDKIVPELGLEIAALEKAGVPVLRSTLTRDPTPPPGEGDEPADKKKPKKKADAED